MSNKLLYILLIAAVTGWVEIDISIPSLPSIANYFTISNGIAQMTIAFNFYGFCIAAIIYGPMSDCYGRRKIILIGNSIMCIGAFGCMIANDINILLISRFIQGVGASAAEVIVFVIIADLCNSEQTIEYNGKLNAIITISMSFAPILGGIINTYYGWHSNYVFIFLLSFISCIIVYKFLPETNKNIKAFNYKKIVNDYKILIVNKDFITISLVLSCILGSHMSFTVCSAFLYTKTYNVSILVYSMYQSLIIISFAIFSEFAGKLNKVLKTKKSIFCGIMLMILQSIILTLSSYINYDNQYTTTTAMVIGSIGTGVIYPIMISKLFEIYPEINGSASSLSLTIKTLVMGLFIAIIGNIYKNSLSELATVISFGNLVCALLIRLCYNEF